MSSYIVFNLQAIFFSDESLGGDLDRIHYSLIFVFDDTIDTLIESPCDVFWWADYYYTHCKPGHRLPPLCGEEKIPSAFNQNKVNWLDFSVHVMPRIQRGTTILF